MITLLIYLTGASIVVIIYFVVRRVYNIWTVERTHIAPIHLKSYFEGKLHHKVDLRDRITRHLGVCQHCQDVLFDIQRGETAAYEEEFKGHLLRDMQDQSSLKMKRRFTR